MTPREAIALLTLDPDVGKCTPEERKQARATLTLLCDTVESCQEMLRLALNEDTSDVSEACPCQV